MSRLLYRLEDHFDAIAYTWRGNLLGKLSFGLRELCAAAGDMLRSRK